MGAYAQTGDYPEALIKIIFTVMEKTPSGGATMEDLKEAYAEARGSYPSSKTIYRAIHRLNKLFDPLAYGETPEPGEDPGGEDEPCEDEPGKVPPLIESKRTTGGTRYLFTGDFPSTTVDANQALLMTLGLYTQQRGILKEHFETVIQTLLRDLLDKINLYQDAFKEIEEHIHVSGHEPADPGKNVDKIKKILEAIRGRKRLTMRYLRSYDGSITRRECEPYGLISRLNSWYLVAQCVERQKRRIFLLDHIKELEILEGSSFRWPEGFSIHDVYSKAWGVWNIDEEDSAEPETVRIKVFQGIAERFNLVCYHDSQEVKMLPGGDAEVTFKVTGAAEMLPWLMSWGTAVQVLEPQWLKEQLLENLKKVSALYESQQHS